MANLTSKELSAIEDQLNMEQLLIKKYRSVAAMSKDSLIKEKCQKIASKHQEHFNKLLSHLK